MASKLSAPQAQRVLDSLELANKLAFQLAEALRVVEAEIITDNEMSKRDPKLNLGAISSVRGSHWLVESAIIAERNAWEGYSQARGNTIA
jgi:hypothetical protein